MTVTALAVFGATVVTAQAETPSPPTASAPVKKRTVLHKASFPECEKKALDLGLVPGQSGRICYVRHCMGLARLGGRACSGRDLQRPRRARLPPAGWAWA
jgi:hypothetical protein